MKRYILLSCLAAMLLCPFSIQASSDTCTVNDICATAIPIGPLVSDYPFTCISACNTGAQAEMQSNACGNHLNPTVWFSVFTDDFAALMNIFVTSVDFQTPTITLYLAVDSCNNLIQVSLTSANISCIVGNNGEAEALGTSVGGVQQYYIAVSTNDGETGNFEMCVNTISNASQCILDRNIEITGRSFGGSLEGPFEPGETVSMCLHVNTYTAANNGCQWFQGLVPVFGSGWDPVSFDINGQPLHATINDSIFGLPGNGLYGSSTWDWFTDVDYHFDNPFLQPGDMDGNGSYDICHRLYEADCPKTGGLHGGCCGPCWGSPLGSLLPGGWFAYGINGSCQTPGPPIMVDWGDGNSCNTNMGPWHFCFDLKVKDFVACPSPDPNDNLSVAFFTFSDGETGSWTGSASICALDQPAKISLPVNCYTVAADLGIESLGAICAGDSLHYVIEYGDVDYWTWGILPQGYVEMPVYTGENGYLINNAVTNSTDEPHDIVYSFIGHYDSTDNIVIKRMTFTVYPQIQFSLPDVTVCERDSTLFLSPTIIGGTGNYNYNWTPTGETTPAIVLNKPFPSTVGFGVADEVGCEHSDIMHIKTRPCHLIGTNPPIDDDNEPDHPKDPPPPDGNMHEPENSIHARGTNTANEMFTILPVPAKERIIISLQQPFTPDDRIVIFDVNGHTVLQLDSGAITGMKKSVDISQLQEGIYYITLFTSRCNATQRMVKM